MIYLVFSITASLTIFTVFKLLERFEVNTFQTIVVNYMVAFCFAIFTNQSSAIISDVMAAQWFWGSIIVGGMFIGIFNIMAWTAQKNGLAVASVASKMSVVIPIIFGVVFYQESIGFQKIVGILFALTSVYLVSVKAKSSMDFKRNLVLPLLLFLGSGISDTFINYLQHASIPENHIPLFSAGVFGFAGIIGIIILSIGKLQKKISWDPKSILGGLVLGLANYASLYYIIKSLQLANMESSTFYTINNVAIVMISTLIGLWFFKEHLNKKNWTGIGMALIAIYLVTFA